MLNELLKDFNLSEDKINKLNKLRDICLEYNEHTNLTSITNIDEFNRKHILDSLSIAKFFDLSNKSILDVGSGGGFPGLVLAIAFPDSMITMLDSNNKKTKYINFASEELEITNVSIITARIEEEEIDEDYDIVLSRAVAPLNILLEITSHAAKIDGDLIYYKGDNLNNEIPDSWNFIEEELGIEFYKIYTFELDDSTTRKIISFKKVWQTKNTYPRQYAVIKKSPLY